MIFSLFSITARGGVWVNAPGTGYAQIGYTHQQASRYFGEDGRIVPQTALLGDNAPLFDLGRYSSNDLDVYLEYGVVKGLEVMASLPYRSSGNRWSFSEGPFEDIHHTNHGLTDLSAGLRAGVTRGGLAVSGLVAGRAPLYDNSPDVLNMEVGSTDFWDDRVPLGPGTMELDIGAGSGIGTKRVWALFDAAVRIRDRQYSSVLPARLQLGVKPFERSHLRMGRSSEDLSDEQIARASDILERFASWVALSSQLALGNGDAPDFLRAPYGNGPLVVDRQNALHLSFGVALDAVAGFGVTAGASRTLAGERFPQLTTVSVGLYSKFRMPWAKEEP